ncbi:prolyl oligopeptidase family serine peptidase [Flavobacterium sp. SM15]|uniref:prolyl oligopeptidase family serine peptidase n=1 Tax=Flavobacterium sp. SM15 TaxID=2908005 RepID=UPI001ED9CD60|nr:prolyl oligopeptidase family serine peptidase [Flavobacterium sp. SM15]MCG2610333.1 prolyl oligopeptidase family serine peptidase [Flavobacterium sp. SM15]
MIKHILNLLSFLVCTVMLSQNSVSVQKNTDTYRKHDTLISDKYAWLENYEASEVKNWVRSENESFQNHYEMVKKDNSSAFKIKEYNYYSSNPMPSKKGRYFYSLYIEDRSKPASLFYRKSLNDDAVMLFNPSKVYKNNTAFVANYHPSKHSKYVACKINTNGSDVHEVKFVDITNNKILEETLSEVKYSDIAWNEDKGVFYTKTSNERVFDVDSTYQLFYHQIGTSQIKDRLIFDTTVSGNYFSYYTQDNKLYITESTKNKDKNAYYFTNLNDPEFKINRFLEDEAPDFQLLKIRNGKVYFTTDQYDWGNIRVFDLENRTSERSLIPQIYTHLLVNSYFLDEYIVCKYKTIAKSYMIVYDYTGKFIRKFDIPFNMDFKVRFYNPETQDLFVMFYSRTIAYQNYQLNLQTGEAKHFFNDYIKPKPTVFPLNYFETKSITYKNRDNKEVPITIIHKKGITMDGNNPTLLEAYGGFGVVSGPQYDTGLLYFLEKGGVYAFAEIRGGGERGKKWHIEGRGKKKKNTFNDFIDAAEFLIREKYTSPNKLGITGASHGGLVVGVAMTQRPELFRVAIPKVGVYDMAKFNLFTVGNYHLDEFGDPQKKEDFKELLSYSPYHNIKETVNYPITLIIASENDNRVTPFQSYKFAAALQNRTAQKNPIYLKTNEDAGHYGKVASYKDQISSEALFYDFLMYHLSQ